jgi:hypothetical protein
MNVQKSGASYGCGAPSLRILPFLVFSRYTAARIKYLRKTKLLINHWRNDHEGSPA